VSTPAGLALPDFPWDQLAPYAAKAKAHAGGLIDLSVGSPVDPTPAVIAEALRQAVDSHAYPAAAGTPALRQAIIAWYQRRRSVPGLSEAEVMPTIGSKELIALLPLLLGLGPDDAVVFPTAAYPTYAVGAQIARAQAVAADDPADWPDNTRLVWLNSPGNPDGSVLDLAQLRAAVARARELGAVIAGDECYAELNWAGDEPTACILDPRVVGEDRSNVLSVYSLSKQSNLAGYRAAFVAGDAALIDIIKLARRHAGLIPPGPVQAAMVAALQDDTHVAEQRERYRARRNALLPVLQDNGFRIDRSTAGLYLWVTRDEDCWVTLDALAEQGILAAPGAFYGPAAAQHVRIALTASDEAIAEAAARLAAR